MFSLCFSNVFLKGGRAPSEKTSEKHRKNIGKILEKHRYYIGIKYISAAPSEKTLEKHRKNIVFT